jgi:hypothetical protein
LPPSVQVTELAEDLSWHPVPRIREALEGHGILESRPRLSVRARPPGQPLE